MTEKMARQLGSRSFQREQRDAEKLWARKEGHGKQIFGDRLIPGVVAKIALNRMAIPKEEPPKWYPGDSLSHFREDAVKNAYYHIRNGDVQYAKVYKVGTEDGVMWGIKTYPKIVPWYVKEGLVNDTDRKKRGKKTKAKRPSKIESFYGVKTNTGKNAERLLKTVYRKKKSIKCKCK